jgi:hypothetical protein
MFSVIKILNIFTLKNIISAIVVFFLSFFMYDTIGIYRFKYPEVVSENKIMVLKIKRLESELLLGTESKDNVVNLCYNNTITDSVIMDDIISGLINVIGENNAFKDDNGSGYSFTSGRVQSAL